MSETVFTEEELEALERKRTVPRFIFIPAGFLGLWSIAHPWPWDNLPCLIFWQAFMSYNLFCWTSCFHECAHQTLCGSQKVSIALGRMIGTVLLVPYTVYRESHIRHHAYLNKPNDWELWPYSDPNTSVWFRRLYVWPDLLLGFLTAPIEYGRIYFHKNSPLKSPQVLAAIRYEYFAILLFWGGLIGWAAYTDRLLLLLNVWVIPHWLAGMFQTGRKLTEHLGMASYDPMLGTRTVLGRNFFTRACTYVNFDIFVHGPHHRHPRVAHNLLEQKMSEYIDEHPNVDFPLYPTYWQATTRMLPFMFSNPGVGMNAGNQAPADEKNPDVQNFVADVTVEVLSEADAALLDAAR